MPRMTSAEYQAFMAKRVPVSESPQCSFEVVIKEADLHGQIIDWCRSQVPAVPYIHARMDRESTIAEGAQDFTVFYRSQCVCVECKSKTGKQTQEQLAWAHLMNAHGFVVHIVRSFQQFLELVTP